MRSARFPPHAEAGAADGGTMRPARFPPHSESTRRRRRDDVLPGDSRRIPKAGAADRGRGRRQTCVGPAADNRYARTNYDVARGNGSTDIQRLETLAEVNDALAGGSSLRAALQRVMQLLDRRDSVRVRVDHAAEPRLGAPARGGVRGADPGGALGPLRHRRRGDRPGRREREAGHRAAGQQGADVPQPGPPQEPRPARHQLHLRPHQDPQEQEVGGGHQHRPAVREGPRLPALRQGSSTSSRP